jgi:N-acetylglucosaminyldiphosphoundecaprenol N-acetyl-beta-D-mannosaminyltransferase
MIRKKIKILNVPIDCFNKKELLEYIDEKISKSKPLFITTVNSEFMQSACKNFDVAKLLKKTSLNLADGVGILWAAKFLSLTLPTNKIARYIIGFMKLIFSLTLIIICPRYIKSPIPERISGSDFIWDIAYFAKKNNLKLYLLGGGPTVAEQAALKLQTEIYDLKISGTFEGTPNLEDENKILASIKKNGPDILLVAFGVPNEELWLDRNLSRTGAKIGIGVGGTFDFLAERRKRSPKIFQSIGLEWLWRLILEPKRFKRQTALPKFIWRVFQSKIND